MNTRQNIVLDHESVTFPDINEPNSSSRKKCRQTSEVWAHFDKVKIFNPEKSPGYAVIKARCHICNELLSCESSNGTSHLRRHHKQCTLKRNIDIKPTQINTLSIERSPTFRFSQDTVQRETIRYIVKIGQPLSIVESSEFKEWINNSFCPQFQTISRNTIRNEIIKKFKEEKEVLINLFKNIPGKICLTCSIWTSNQDLSYICLTAHFLDSEWNLQKRIISFPLLETPYTWVVISSTILHQLRGWGIQNKIFSITLDNALANEDLVNYLKRSIPVNCNGQLFHMHCCCQILNLIVKDGLEIIKDSIERIKQVLLYIYTSQSRYQEFREACKAFDIKCKKIPLNVRHQWNSTYLMLDAVIPYQYVINQYLLGKTISKISNDDWNSITIIKDILKVFYNAIICFSGIYYPTSSQVLCHLVNINLIFQQYRTTPKYFQICYEMEIKFKKFWTEIPLILGLATVMDPRIKLRGLEIWIECINDNDSKIGIERLNEIKLALTTLFENYQSQRGTIVGSNSEAASSSSQPHDRVWKLLRSRLNCSIESGCSSELQRYLDQPNIDEDDDAFDILAWWKEQESRLPVLSAMARDLLTIPVSTVALESAFIEDKHVLDDYQSWLSPKMVEYYICLRDWYKAEDRTQNMLIEEDLEEIEKVELDTSA